MNMMLAVLLMMLVLAAAVVTLLCCFALPECMTEYGFSGKEMTIW